MKREQEKPDTVGRLRLAVEVLKGKGDDAIARYCAEGLPVPPPLKIKRASLSNLTPAGLVEEYNAARMLKPLTFSGSRPEDYRRYGAAMGTWRARVLEYLRRQARKA